MVHAAGRGGGTFGGRPQMGLLDALALGVDLVEVDGHQRDSRRRES